MSKKPWDNSNMFKSGVRASEPPLPVAKADLTGRTVIIIGANVGLGFECAKHMARMNPSRLVLGCRNEREGSRAVEDIKKETSFQNVELRLIDLAKFVSVRSFAQKFIEEVGTLDILLANAAILPTKHESTVDGWEVALQVNHLSLSLLTLLLLPTMIETSKTSKNSPRIVMVTSQMHTQTTLDDELLALPQEDGSSILRYMSDEDMGKGYCKREEIINRRYGDTKLFGVFFARTLSDRLSKSKSNIIVNVVDPGRCVSQLIRTLPDTIRENMMTLAIEDGYTTEEGSRALVYGAVGELDKDPETGSLGEEKLRGAHLRRGRKTEFGEFVLTEEGEKLGSRIWDETIDILREVDGNIGDIHSKFLC